MIQKVGQSMLAPAVVESRVIPNGVDLSVFHPSGKQEVRDKLDLPQDSRVLLFSANEIRQNVWKDYRTMRAAIMQVAENLPGQRVLFLALGEAGPLERIGQAEIRFIPYQKDQGVVALYHQAADIYIHAARAESWGLTITEALACGTPVVATAVGGIPEQVTDNETGFLVPPRVATTMAEAIIKILTNEALRVRLGSNAAQDAQKRFSLNQQVDAYLEWYRAIIERQNLESASSHSATTF
jgi:glycosyltransferase involved in cell wall biosynthesis